MTEFKAIGPFGIFRQDDIMRATPRESSTLSVEISHLPQSHIEDFKFIIVKNTLIQVELIVKSYDDVEAYEKFVDTSNDRVTRRKISLSEDDALKSFGFDAETAPPKSSMNEKITKSRAQGINVRIWIKKYKDYLRKRAEFDEASAAMTAQPTDPNYAEEYGRVLKKQPSDSDIADFGTYAPRIINAMSERLMESIKDEDYVNGLEPLWDKADGDPVQEMRKELLAEYMANMFSQN
jgi:hypothetical protein